MNSDLSTFSRPATNVASCMAVTGCMPGVFPANVAVLAIAEFRKDFPLLADRLDSMRAAAMVRGGGVAGSLRDGGGDGADFSAYPDGNYGDNLINLTDKGAV